MKQQLDQAYANVMEFGAKGNGYDDDTAAIQDAINTGKHVLFPQGTVSPVNNPDGTLNHTELNPYVLYMPLKFNNEGQKCTFLSGASLELDTNLACVIISGKSQTFSGLRISTGTSVWPPNKGRPAVPDPCLVIEGADGLLLEDLHVESTHQSTLVRILNTDGIAIQGGRISGGGYGHHKDEKNVGLELGSGVKNFSAVSLAIDNTGFGVVLKGTTETISFLDCTIEQQTENMIEVQGQVHGLSVVGLHTESGGGAYRFFVVQPGAGVYGGVFTGCQLGNLNEAAQSPRRVFVIDGDWHGVNVYGCEHNAQSPTVWGGRDAIWEIGRAADISQSCDMLNQWDHFDNNWSQSPSSADTGRVVAGTDVARFPIVHSDNGKLVLTAGGIRVDTPKIGFFGAVPAARRWKYSVGSDHRRVLGASPESAYMVLTSLLKDLARLGLIECEVR